MGGIEDEDGTHDGASLGEKIWKNSKKSRKINKGGLCSKFLCLPFGFLGIRNDQSHYACKWSIKVSSKIFF